MVNGWRHGLAYIWDARYHHLKASRSLDVDDLAAFAEFGIAIWEASQTYFAAMSSIGATQAGDGADDAPAGG